MSESIGPKESSVPLPEGGDTHFDLFGPDEKDFTVTTRLPGGIVDHTNPVDPDNAKTNNFGLDQ